MSISTIIQDEVYDRTFQSIFNAGVLAFGEMEDTVAKEKGVMRQALRFGIANMIGMQKGKTTITISREVTMQIAERMRAWVRYHTVQDPQFNSNYNPSGYANPTTANTKPFDWDDFLNRFRAKLPQTIRSGFS